MLLRTLKEQSKVIKTVYENIVFIKFIKFMD